MATSSYIYVRNVSILVKWEFIDTQVTSETPQEAKVSHHCWTDLDIKQEAVLVDM